MIDAVIFDMDGLMFNTEVVWSRCLAPALEELGLPFNPELPEHTRGTAGTEFAKVIHEFYGPEVNAYRLWDVWHELVSKELEKGVEKKLGLDELLEYLSENNISCAVASSSIPEHIKRNLENAGITDKFAVTVSSLNLEHAKPEPDVFLKAAELLNVEPANALVLEDSYNGVRAGAAGGFKTIMVPDLSAPTDEMHQLAYRICDSLLEVRDLLASGELN